MDVKDSEESGPRSDLSALIDAIKSTTNVDGRLRFKLADKCERSCDWRLCVISKKCMNSRKEYE